MMLFIRNAQEIWNYDKFKVLKVIRYLQNFSQQSLIRM